MPRRRLDASRDRRRSIMIRPRASAFKNPATNFVKKRLGAREAEAYNETVEIRDFLARGSPCADSFLSLSAISREVI